MNICTVKIPDISKDMQFTLLQQIADDTSVIIIFKTFFRSDDIIIDVYKDDINNSSKIISGVRLTPNSLICLPNRDINFPYYINCVDQDRVSIPINKNNAHKFYLQFTSYDSGRINQEQ